MRQRQGTGRGGERGDERGKEAARREGREADLEGGADGEGGRAGGRGEGFGDLHIHGALTRARGGRTGDPANFKAVCDEHNRLISQNVDTNTHRFK